jgi:outer membrane protein assembly factor BamB
VTTSPGVVYEGSTDGKLRAYSARTGAVLWEYDTVRDFAGVNGLTGHGGVLTTRFCGADADEGVGPRSFDLGRASLRRTGPGDSMRRS